MSDRWTRSRRLVALCRILVVSALALCGAATLAQSETLVFHGSQSGERTLDRDAEGGNPFASSLIELLARPSLALDRLPASLRRLTARKSNGFQRADVPATVAMKNVALVPAKAGERRVALVMVVSDYARSGGAPMLPGAKFDAHRIAAAFERAGFETEVALDLDLGQMRVKLAQFRSRAAGADTAALYTTGHGVEVDGTIYLLPGDYPVIELNDALPGRALPFPEMIRAVSARKVNLVFFAGCRDNPFAQ